MIVREESENVIAEKVAAAVLAKIGDQLKVNDRFIMALTHMMEYMRDGAVMRQQIGYGPWPLQVDWYFHNDRITMTFISMNGEQLGTWTLHK